MREPCLVFLCRNGFETECAAEALRTLGVPEGEVRITAHRGAGWVRLRSSRDDGVLRLAQGGVRNLVFARQGFQVFHRLSLSDFTADGSVLLECLDADGVKVAGVHDVFVEAADSESGRRLWPLCRRLEEELEATIGPRPVGSKRRKPAHLRLHLFLPDDQTIWVGYSDPKSSSPWPMGIPRLRQSPSAPSRSALKLEEALLTFLDTREREQRLKAGMRAVDLGAAPGGWSWVLTRYGLVVRAVDNGPMDAELLRGGLVEHVRADGFTYRPEYPIDWLVCDMVSAPQRVARRIAWWGCRGLCHDAIFNLKLPSGQSLQALDRCRQLFAREFGNAGVAYALHFKQLYHDRAEVTGYLRVENAGRGGTHRPAVPQTPRTSRRRPRADTARGKRGKKRAA